MGFLRRLLGSTPPDDDLPDPGVGSPVPVPTAVESHPAQPAPTPAQPVPPPLPRSTGLACPYCAGLIDPPPVRNRLCPRCRQPIVVRRVDGRLILLSEAAVAVFEAERQREADELAWTAARGRWLRRALQVKVPADRRARLASAPISAEVVEASRRLYLSTVEAGVRAARHDKRWGDVGRLRREQAEALFEEAGSPVPPPDEITELHREGMTAVLRSLIGLTTYVELVSAECCRPCRAEGGETFRTTSEVRVGRLPHAGCPKGLCRCDWWPAVVAPRKRRRRRVSAAAPAPALPPDLNARR